ncbi:glycoside hydrolase family 76 protein [Saccharicrinis sp. FJH62]|uniref:glycoside hydrolase family 76 protein n=1 Tax=Saccharicrinis sp. FJH62 TaxID=3344657 RepID=UPI0035D51BA5
MHLSKHITIILAALIFSVFQGSAKTFDIVSGSTYIIRSKASNKVLSVENSSLENNARIVIWTDTGSDAQKWIATDIGDQVFTFTNLASQKVLHITGGIIDQYQNTGDKLVKWTMTDAGDGSTYIKTVANTDYLLDLEDGLSTEGTHVKVFQTSDSETQKWFFEPQDPTPSAPSPEVMDNVFSDWIKAYYDTRNGNEVVKGEGFWAVAEIMEIVDDAFEVSGDVKYITLFNAMYNQFIAREGQDWMWNEYNDDITWMVLACTRAYLYTGSTKYLTIAKTNFDNMYARAATNDFGGGLIWKQGVMSKNACINGPAMVACCYLAEATGDNTYIDKAKEIYEWSKLYLFDPNSGKVNDAYYLNTDNNQYETNYWSSTYNQGTYLGAAIMLYNHTKDPQYLLGAHYIADYTKNTMFNSRVINSEDGRDLEGFKGIYQRYARRYVNDCNRSDYIPWLQLNAKMAYNNRNSQGLIQTLWGTKTPENVQPTAFSASTAVSLLVNCPMEENIVKDAYQIIEAENFTYLSGIITAACSEGTDMVRIKNGGYMAYYNVDFGLTGSATAEIRASCELTGGSIEIHSESETGPLLGTFNIPSTGSYDTYTAVSCEVTNIKGLQNIYLVYSGSGTMLNINYFTFTEAEETGSANGLLGSYYNGMTFNTPTLEQIDSVINFDWGTLSPVPGISKDYYSIRWTGQIEPRFTDAYTFYITSDNGRRLWINDQLIIDKWISDWDITYSGNIALEAGKKYSIKLEYFEEVGGANIKLEWESKTQQVREVIPASQLFLPEQNSTAIKGPDAVFPKVNLYPNPVTERLFIGGKAYDRYVITDLKGKICMKDQITNNQAGINVSDLSQGLYFIQLVNKKGDKTISKFIRL